MSQYVRFPMESGPDIFVEVDASALRPTTRSGVKPGALADTASATFEESLGRVQPAAEAVVRQLRALESTPDSIEVEFALQMSGEMGAVIGKVGGQANFKVKLIWRSD